MSGRLLTGRFVAVFPSLVRALGSMEAAAVLQYVAYAQDGDAPVRLRVSTIAADTGLTETSVKRYTRVLADLGVLAKTQTTPGTPLAYAVRRDHPILSAAERGEVPDRAQSAAGSRMTPDRDQNDTGTGTTLTPVTSYREVPQKIEPRAAAAATVQGTLIDVPAPGREPTGADLYAAFVDGYRERHGRDPDPIIRGPLLGMVRRVTTTRTDVDSWRDAWHAFRSAGHDGRPTRVQDHLLRIGQTVPAWRANHDLDALVGAASWNVSGPRGTVTVTDPPPAIGATP